MTSSESTTGNSANSFCILHDSDTDMGPLMLRRRWSFALEREVFEMTLDGKLMMSSAAVTSELALAERALAVLPHGHLRVLIGGLGFGFTAQAALADSRVREVTVIERLAPVIAWHRSHMLPWSRELVADPRLKVMEDDFFAFIARDTQPIARFDAILIDIDDSPTLLWHDSHASFYEASGLEGLHRHLQSAGVLALWCATHPGESFINAARTVFAATTLLEVEFENPCVRQQVTHFLLLARAHPKERESDGKEHSVTR